MTDSPTAPERDGRDDDRHAHARRFIVAEARVQARHGLKIVDVLAGWPDAYQGQSEFISPDSPPSTIEFFLRIQDCLAAVGLLGQLLWPGRLHKAPDGRERDPDYQRWAVAGQRSSGVAGRRR